LTKLLELNKEREGRDERKSAPQVARTRAQADGGETGSQEFWIVGHEMMKKIIY
jgi:hypothetical protein